MFRLGEAILQTLFEVKDGEQSVGQDPIVVMRSKYPDAAARDVASELTVLAAQGFIKLTAQNGAVITAAGLRKIHDIAGEHPDGFQTTDFSAQAGTSPAAVTQTTGEGSELELDEIISLISSDEVKSDELTLDAAEDNEYLPETLDEEPNNNPPILSLNPIENETIDSLDKHTWTTPSQIVTLRGEIERLQREIMKLETSEPAHYLRLVTITKDLQQATDQLDTFIRTKLSSTN